jgi:hypothetical protein
MKEIIKEDNILMSENQFATRDAYNLTHICIFDNCVVKTVYTDMAHWKGAMMITLRANRPNTVVPVLSYSLDISLVFNGKTYAFAYSYTMKKLLPLSEHEKDIIHIYNSTDDVNEDVNEDKDYVRRFSRDEQEELMDREANNNTAFYRFLMNNQDLLSEYTDLHEENIMKDEHDNYYLIDLEGFTVEAFGD